MSVRCRKLLFASAVFAAMGIWLTRPISNSWANATAPAAAPAAVPQLAFQGVASCAAMNCHGGVGAKGQKSCEYTTWVSDDPHAKAYSVLFLKRSIDMGKKLGLTTPPSEAKVCLDCHVTNAPTNLRGPRFSFDDGVGCESCHGAAEKWLGLHVTSAWKTEYATPVQKAEVGMTDLKDIKLRLTKCASCHVSTPGAEVNHDLIAAGHPRMVFEAGAMHANLPKHWDAVAEKKANPAIEAKIWAVGQAVGAESTLRVLSARADDVARPWPEFAEFDCFACHHDLNDPSWRQRRGYSQKPGALPWASWPLPMIDSLSKNGPAAAPKEVEATIYELSRLMAQPYPSRPKVATEAKRGADALAAWAAELNAASFGQPETLKLLKQVLASSTSDSPRSWDQAVQEYLAIVALHESYRDQQAIASGSVAPINPALANQLRSMVKTLRFPDAFDSPREFQPEQAKIELKKISEMLKP